MSALGGGAAGGSPGAAAVTFGGSTYSVLQALFSKYGYGDKFAEYLNIPDNEGKAIALVQGRAAAVRVDGDVDRLVGNLQRINRR